MSDQEGPPDGPGHRSEPLPPEDRLWRHPSEVARPEPAPNRRRLTSLALAAGIGASAALLMSWGVGAFDDRDGVGAPGAERLATPVSTLLAGGPPDGGISDTAESLVAVRVEGTTGSGVILRSDGHILTTADLVGDHRRVTVQAVAGPEREALVVGADPATDVAVLRVEGLAQPGAVLEAVQRPDVGDPARAVSLRGPNAEILAGAVVNLAVSVDTDEGPRHGLIGTDIVTTDRLEGAALVDAGGSVIGITTGVGPTTALRAVPIGLARIVASDIIRTGAAAHPWLGVQGRDLDSQLAAAWGVRGGAELVEVEVDSPAATAGLHDDDVVTQVGATPVASMGDLITALRHLDPGDEVRIGYVRTGTHRWCEVVLAPPA